MLWWKRMWKKLSVNYNFEKFPKANFDIVWCSIDIVKIIWMRWQEYCSEADDVNIIIFCADFSSLRSHRPQVLHQKYCETFGFHYPGKTLLTHFFELPYRQRYYVPLRNVFNMKKLQLAFLFSLIGGVIWIYGKGERDPTPRVFRSTGSLCFRDCKSSFVH